MLFTHVSLLNLPSWASSANQVGCKLEIPIFYSIEIFGILSWVHVTNFVMYTTLNSTTTPPFIKFVYVPLSTKWPALICIYGNNIYIELCSFACWDLQRNLPTATGSGSTKATASGWAAFWLCENLVIVIEIFVWCFFFYKRKKEKKGWKQEREWEK